MTPNNHKLFLVVFPYLPCMKVIHEVKQPLCCCVFLTESQQQGLPLYRCCCQPSLWFSGVGALSPQCTHLVETQAVLDCWVNAFPGSPRPFPVKIRDLPGVSHSFQLMQLDFSSMEMESPGRGQNLGRIGLVSWYRVGWVVNSEYPGPADTYLCLHCLCRACFQPRKFERVWVLSSYDS